MGQIQFVPESWHSTGVTFGGKQQANIWDSATSEIDATKYTLVDTINATTTFNDPMSSIYSWNCMMPSSNLTPFFITKDNIRCSCWSIHEIEDYIRDECSRIVYVQETRHSDGWTFYCAPGDEHLFTRLSKVKSHMIYLDLTKEQDKQIQKWVSERIGSRSIRWERQRFTESYSTGIARCRYAIEDDILAVEFKLHFVGNDDIDGLFR